MTSRCQEKTERHELPPARRISKNGCEWDSNPWPHQLETCPGIKVAAIFLLAYPGLIKAY